MIGYVTLGTNDLARAAKFYDTLFAEIGGKRRMESDRFISWSAGEGSPGFGVIKPFDGKAATPGNGAMVATRHRLASEGQSAVRQSDEARRKGRRSSRACAGARSTPPISATSTATSSTFFHDSRG